MQQHVDCKHCVNSKKAKFGIKQPNFKGIAIIDSLLGLKTALSAMCAILLSNRFRKYHVGYF